MQEPVSRKFEIWPWAIAIFLVLFVGFLAGYAVLTGFNRTELVSPDYYDEEIQYQQHIDSQNRANALPEKVQIRHRSAEQQLAVQFPAPGEDASPTGTITLYRPSDAGLDQMHALALDTSGAQVIDIAGLKPGLWRIKLEWVMSDLAYFQEDVLVLEK